MRAEIITDGKVIPVEKGSLYTYASPTGAEVIVYPHHSGTWVGVKLEALTGAGGKLSIKDTGVNLHSKGAYVALGSPIGASLVTVKNA